MNILGLKTTKQWIKYWSNRKLTFDEYAISDWNHPHRYVISAILKNIPFISLMDIGCKNGANLMNILKTLGNKQIGGVDVNKNNVELLEKRFRGGVFKKNTGDDIMLSDKAVDIVLSDMSLIYVGPTKIKKYLREFKRIGRNYVLLCELHSDNPWERLWLRLTKGIYIYNYKKILKSMGFYGILTHKLRPEEWQGLPHTKYAYIFLAKIPKY